MPVVLQPTPNPIIAALGPYLAGLSGKVQENQQIAQHLAMQQRQLAMQQQQHSQALAATQQQHAQSIAAAQQLAAQRNQYDVANDARTAQEQRDQIYLSKYGQTETQLKSNADAAGMPIEQYVQKRADEAQARAEHHSYETAALQRIPINMGEMRADQARKEQAQALWAQQHGMEESHDPQLEAKRSEISNDLMDIESKMGAPGVPAEDLMAFHNTWANKMAQMPMKRYGAAQQKPMVSHTLADGREIQLPYGSSKDIGDMILDVGPDGKKTFHNKPVVKDGTEKPILLPDPTGQGPPMSIDPRAVWHIPGVGTLVPKGAQLKPEPPDKVAEKKAASASEAEKNQREFIEKQTTSLMTGTETRAALPADEAAKQAAEMWSANQEALAGATVAQRAAQVIDFYAGLRMEKNPDTGKVEKYNPPDTSTPEGAKKKAEQDKERLAAASEYDMAVKHAYPDAHKIPLGILRRWGLAKQIMAKSGGQ